MIAGRKLLLADDSLAIQKVVDLTFTDEGMEVTTVSDGRDALEKLNQFRPDVVLADVYMPGVDGYELCNFIKQSERFRGVPVMLLIGTFEPFDEAEARRVGADDVVTKPFQSIRQLVSRVGSLLGNDEAVKNETAQKYSMLGLGQAEGSKQDDEVSRQEPEASMQETEGHSDVRVFVEAPVMADSEAESAEEHTCPPDIELQTADTRELERIDDMIEIAPAKNDFDDTIEIEAVVVSDEQAPAPETVASQSMAGAHSEDMHYQAQAAVGESFEDGVLDLGDVDSFVSTQAEDDFVLDLDGEPGTTAEVREPVAVEPAATAESAVMTESIPEDPPAMAEAILADTQQWEIVTPVSQSEPEEETRSIEPPVNQASVANLSPEAIEAISRRVVEQLSDKVVREIAWEVVPELSELLIKKKLEEQK